MLKKGSFLIFGVILLINSLVVGYGSSSSNLYVENNNHNAGIYANNLPLFNFTWNLTNFTNITDMIKDFTNSSNDSDDGPEDDEPQDSLFNVSDYDYWEENISEANVTFNNWNVSNVTCPNCTIIICSNCTFNISDFLENETPVNLTDEMVEDEYGEKIYIYGNGLIASKNNNQITYYHQDFLGSNRFITNDNGEITGKNVQEPYGSDFSDKGTRRGLSNNYKFTGKEEDDNNLYYFGARYYGPNNARFISVDPVFDPGISPYAYANDNPLKYVDPDGKRAVFADNIKNRASPIIDFLARYSYSVKEIKENDFFIKYAEVDDWKDLSEMYGIDPSTLSRVQPRYGYTDIESMRVFIRPGLKGARFFHTLAHESMHAFSLTQERDLIVSRHADNIHMLLDELRVELKLKYELGLDKPYNPDIWSEVGFSSKEFEELKKINNEQMRYYLRKLNNIVGEKEAKNYFEGLDEYVKDKTDKGEWVY